MKASGRAVWKVEGEVEDLRQALLAFKDTYNRGWLLERLGFRSPRQTREAFTLAAIACITLAALSKKSERYT